MKKTLIAILALGGVALGAESLPVWTSGTLDVGTTQSVGLSPDLGLNTTDGVTAMITLNWTGVSNAPLFWLGTDDGSAYTSSVATFGYRGNIYHSSLFSTGGSNAGITNLYNNVTAEVKTPDYISAVVNNTAKNGSLADKALTFFMTSQDGNSALYEVMDDNSIVLLCTQGNMKTGNITGYHVGHWSGQASAQTGAATVALYNKVLTPDEMKSIVVPEPATATLSLLALAGLCARRRRH